MFKQTFILPLLEENQNHSIKKRAINALFEIIAIDYKL